MIIPKAINVILTLSFTGADNFEHFIFSHRTHLRKRKATDIRYNSKKRNTAFCFPLCPFPS
jgi:hypothetical protein